MSFKEEAKAVILKGGSLLKEGDNYYWGWNDYDEDINGWREKHESGCHWVATEDSKIVEKTYYEFAGTDADSSQETLLVLTDVDCFCGRLKGRRIGMQGSTGQLLHAILGIEVDYE